MPDDTLITVPLQPTETMIDVLTTTARMFGRTLTHNEAYAMLATAIEAHIQEQDQ